MSNSTISSYLITYLKSYLTKPYTLYILQYSHPLQNITNVVPFQQDILQLCKLKSKRLELFINYSHAAVRRILQQMESSSLFNLPILRFILEIKENI